MLQAVLISTLLVLVGAANRCSSPCIRPDKADWLNGYASIGEALVAARKRNDTEYAGSQCSEYVTWSFKLPLGVNVSQADSQARDLYAADLAAFHGHNGTRLVEVDNDVITNPPDPGRRLCLSYMAFYYCAVMFPTCEKCHVTNPEDALCDFVCMEKVRRCGSVCSCGNDLSGGTCMAGNRDPNVTEGTARCYHLDHKCVSHPKSKCSRAARGAAASLALPLATLALGVALLLR